MSLTPALSWGASAGAASYDVNFGASASPSFAANTTSTSYSPSALARNTTYHWQIAAKNSNDSTNSAIWSFTTICISALSQSTASVGGGPSTGSVPVTGPAGCGWAAISNVSWITIISGGAGNGSGTVNYSVAANTGAQRVGTLTIGGLTFTVTQEVSPLLSQSYLISTLAGGAMPATATLGTSVSIQIPVGLAIDSSGYVYFSSPGLNSVFKADPSGALVRIAGTGVAGYSGDGFPSFSAQLSSPSTVSLDGAGSLYIADSGNCRVRKIDAAGTITTVAGNGSCGFSGDGGAATSSKLFYPFGVAVDSNNNLYVADSNNERIRKVNADGTITTIAGNGTIGYSGDVGAATGAQFNYPSGVAVDAAGNLYIADSNNERIRKVSAAGTITTVAGNGTVGYSGDGGSAIGAGLSSPNCVAVDAGGNLYISDTNDHRIRRVSAAGTITTMAGNGRGGYSGDGGTATSAQLFTPYGVALDSSGNLYVADEGNDRIRRISAAGAITTFAGGGLGDGGAGVLGFLNIPRGVARDNAGNTYVADTNNNRVREVLANGTIITVAGTGTSGFSGDGGVATGPN